MLPYAKIDKLVLALKMITEPQVRNVKHAKRLAKNVLRLTGEGK